MKGALKDVLPAGCCDNQAGTCRDCRRQHRTCCSTIQTQGTVDSSQEQPWALQALLVCSVQGQGLLAAQRAQVQGVVSNTAVARAAD
jgi:hypothetical protein